MSAGDPDQDLAEDAVIERISVQEAARAAGKTDRTVRRWVSSGRLAAVQVDGAYMVTREDLDELVEELAEAEATKAPPKRPEVPAGLIPIETVNTIIEELSRLHQERSDAIERAARAEERERFQIERRKLAEAQLAEIERLRTEAALPPPPAAQEPADTTSDTDNAEPSEKAVSDDDVRAHEAGRVRTAWRALWA